MLKPGSCVLLAWGYPQGHRLERGVSRGRNHAPERERSILKLVCHGRPRQMEVELPADPAAEAVGAVNDIIDEVGAPNLPPSAPPGTLNALKTQKKSFRLP